MEAWLKRFPIFQPFDFAQDKPSRLPHIVLILLLAFFLRTHQLGSQALRGDEAATVHYAALPVNELWELSRITDPHPPLYYLMLHPWRWFLGDEAWVMRLAGVMASVLAVAVLYRLSRRTLGSTGISLLAAGLLAVNPFQIWLAQDVRSYPFFTLLGLLSSWVLWQALHSDWGSAGGRWQVAGGDAQPDTTHYSLHVTRHASRITPWLLYTVATVACFYIHYYTIFLILFQGFFVLLNARRFCDKRWLWLVSQIAIGLWIIPGLGLAYNFIGQAAGGIDKISTGAILQRTATSLLTGFTLDTTSSLWISLLLIPIWLIGFIVLLRQNFTSGSFWVLFCVVPILGVIALSIDRPFFKERFLIQAQPAFEVLLATGFLALVKRPPTADRRPPINNKSPLLPRPPAPLLVRSLTLLLLLFLLTANFLSLTNYFTNPTYAKAPPWHLYHDYVGDHARPGDVMLTNFPEAAVSYYSPDELPFYVVPDERDLPVSARLEATQSIAGAYARIWFLPLLRQGFDEQGDVLHWLDRHSDRVAQVFFPVYNVNLYLSPPTIEANMIRQPVTFAHGISLRGFQIFDELGQSRLTPPELGSDGGQPSYLLTVKPDRDVTLSLYWQSDGPTEAPYTVFTHLIAADGFNRTGQDNQPVWGSYPTTEWQPGERITDKYTLTLPAGTPPGDHRLRVGWYQPETGERVPVVDEDGQSVADQVILDVVVRVEERKE